MRGVSVVPFAVASAVIVLAWFVDLGDATRRLDGTFVWAPGLSLEDGDLASFMDEISSLGMNIAVVQQLRGVSSDATCPSDDFEWIVGYSDWDWEGWVTSLLDNAQRTGVSVYLGLSGSGPCWDFYTGLQKSYTTADTEWLLSQFSSTLLNHPALAGWYIPDEAAIPLWTDVALTFSYYSGLVETIHEFSPLPVTVSPYLSGARTYNVTPDVVARRAKEFADGTGIDVQIWQDSVGADAINVFNRTDYTLSDYFSALSSVLPIFWSDNEAFNWGENLEGGGYHSCSLSRFELQLKQSEIYVPIMLTWIQQLHFGTVSDSLQPEALRMLHTYKSWFSIAEGYGRVSYTYTYVTPPASEYPDSYLNKLNDGWIGDPVDYTSENWVGVLGTASVILTINPSSNVDWVSVHLQGSPPEAINFPSALTITTSRDSGTTWQTIGKYKTPLSVTAVSVVSEYVLGNNDLPLGIAPQQPGSPNLLVRLDLENTQWTFLSEIEVSADPL
ncbi:hypothetical protein Pelo_10789 [Pelomyxa schiedti]|nr:hypothetical protein Pelo_10789 [Pelomyxa schiedti]